MPETCPRCGDPVAYGLEYRGLYDGALIWVDAAGHQWPRFPVGTRLGDLGLRTIQEHA